MQPLISPVDHECRHSDYQSDEETQIVSEDTPLLPRFPPTAIDDTANVITSIIVGMMILVLVSGFTIGVYLLVLQNNADNMLPPIEMPHFVARSKWDEKNLMTPKDQDAVTFKAKAVVIEQTDTGQCEGKKECTEMLNAMQAKLNDNITLPYNFAIATDGYIYECLGWDQPSPLFPQLYGLVIAFIGNYTEVSPSIRQLESVYNIITVSLANDYLDKDFVFSSKNGTTLVVSSLKKSLTALARSKQQQRNFLLPKKVYA